MLNSIAIGIHNEILSFGYQKSEKNPSAPALKAKSKVMQLIITPENKHYLKEKLNVVVLLQLHDR